MLVRTRAVVALAQPESPTKYAPREELRNFGQFASHLEAVLKELMQPSIPSLPAATGSSQSIIATTESPPDPPTNSGAIIPTTESPTDAPADTSTSMISTTISPTDAPAESSKSIVPTAESPTVPPATSVAIVPTTESPTDPTARYTPSRWLLLSCYEATHIEPVRPTRREGLAIALFQRLTGLKVLLPPSRHAAATARELYDEAIVIHRRIGQLGQVPPHNGNNNSKLRVWLLGRPDALAPRTINSHNFVDEQPALRGKPRPRPAPIGHGKAFGSSAQRPLNPGSGGGISNAGALAFYQGHPEGYIPDGRRG